MLYLVLENNFTQLTVNSIKKNMPYDEYKVVNADGKCRITTALEHAKGLTMVVAGGIALSIKDGDLPPAAKMKNKHLAMSREAVFADHRKFQGNYDLIDPHLHAGVVDMSIFLINPDAWSEKDKETANSISTKEILYMPRYMNHRDDPTISLCMGGYDIMEYAALGEDAAVLNYLTHLYQDAATPRDTWACCFDKLLPFVDGLPEKERKIVERLGNLTKKRVGKLRKAIADKEKAPK